MCNLNISTIRSFNRESNRCKIRSLKENNVREVHFVQHKISKFLDILVDAFYSITRDH